MSKIAKITKNKFRSLTRFLFLCEVIMPAYEEVLQWLLEDWTTKHNKAKADKLWRVCKSMKARYDALRGVYFCGEGIMAAAKRTNKKDLLFGGLLYFLLYYFFKPV
jgi:hypothetical protein